jgi:hypothetical protein
MSVSARFKCAEIKHVDVGPAASCATITFQAAYGDGKGNESWSKATPSGKLEMTVTNPAAIEAFRVGKTFQLEFTPVD